MFRIQPHILLVIARQVHEVETKLEAVIIWSLSATGKPVL
jgi:hypothetical protein